MAATGPLDPLLPWSPEAIRRAARRQKNGWEEIAFPTRAGGVSKKETIFRKGTLSLDHYEARSSEIYRVPLLFVMPPTSKAYIFDLLPGQSFSSFCLRLGTTSM